MGWASHARSELEREGRSAVSPRERRFGTGGALTAPTPSRPSQPRA
jgi:hypothetical protein